MGQVENLDSYRFCSTKKLLDEIGMSRTSLNRFIASGKFIEGIHFTKWPGARNGKLNWNARLVKDRIINLSDDQTHQKAINFYLKAANNQ